MAAYEPPSPPASPLNDSTEAPNATLSESLTCKIIRRKRQRDNDDLEKSELEPVLRRRRLSTPKKPVKSRLDAKSKSKSTEVKQFELSIATGQWRNLLTVYGPALKRSSTVLEDVDLNLFDAYGFTSLHAAISLQDVELTIVLLKQGARYDIATLSGWTPFHLAASNPRMLLALVDFLAPKKS